MTADPAALLGTSVLGGLLVLLALVTVLGRMRTQRDEIFVGVTPGLLPHDLATARRERVPGLEWNGPVAAQFTPPAGATPGTIGTIIDGVADARDVSATLVDLAVRGWFTIAEVPPPSGGKRDWELARAATIPDEPLTPFERLLVDRLFATAPVVRMSGLKGEFAMTMREAQVGLYRDALDRGWYRKHPRAKNSWLRRLAIFLGIPLSLVAVVVCLTSVLVNKDLSLLPLGAGIVLTTVILIIWGSTRTPRTAEGTAARIQAMGFRRYIETAEARQIRFEEAQTIFSRYLPYAMAFGLAAVWAKLFAEVAVLAHNAGFADSFLDLGWYDVLDLAGGGLELIAGVSDVADLVGSFGDIGDGLGAAFEGISGAVDGVGDFMSSASDLFSIGDGCDLGGCDLGGCDF